MKMFEVYNLFDFTPIRAKGCYLWGEKGKKYLDLYGGHAVISIGHSHPHYIKTISNQLQKIGYYSNAVNIKPQQEVSSLLGRVSGYPNYQLFMVNSGAEANENALKLASFYNKKEKVLAFKNAFHGRTSMALAVTDNKAITAPINCSHQVVFAELNNLEALEKAFRQHEFSSVIVEGIQGVAGIQIPSAAFLKKIATLCKANDTVFIIDEVQSGFGRTGHFFAHQYAGVKPDIISIAKGMGNGFPVAGILIAPKFKPEKGMLGTTFGGNYLACAATKSVLEIIQKENLITNASKMGKYITEKLSDLPQIKEIRAKGLMIGLEFHMPCTPIRQQLFEKHHILTGNARQPNTLRILPALNVGETEIDLFIKALKEELHVNA